MPKYTVQGPTGLVHKGKVVEPGRSLTLEQEQAYPLIRLGYLKDPGDREPVEGSALESPDAPEPLVQPAPGVDNPKPAPRSTTSRKPA